MTERRAACLNCGASLTGEFCASCGQRDADPRISVREMAHEFAAELFGLDSKVARTMGTLVLHPGRITNDFFEGRRARYIAPLRLYLWSSVLFFLLFTTFGGRTRTVTSPSGTRSILDSVSASDSSGSVRKALADTAAAKHRFEHSVDSILAINPRDNAAVRFFKRRARARVQDVVRDRQNVMQAGTESFQHRLPDAIFLLVPLVAAILYVLYRGSGRYYAEHLVFALHVQAFAFVVLMATLLPSPWITPLVMIWLAAYIFMAMRTVYGEGRGRTGAKFVVLTFSYSLALAATMAVLAAIVFLFG